MHHYRKKHVRNKIDRIKPKEPFYKNPFFWGGFLVLILVSVIVYVLFFCKSLQVNEIIISGNEKVFSEDIKQIVKDGSNTGLLNLWNLKISSNNIFLANTNKIRSKIINDFPIIEKINITKKYPQTLTVQIQERKPIGVYCSNDQENKKCFLIDQNGIIFEPIELDYLQADKTLIESYLNNGQIFAGEQVVATEIINAIYAVQKNLKEKFQIDLASALVTSPVRMDVKTAEGWKIYFYLRQDQTIDEQITKLNLLLSGEVSQESRKNLRYINLIPDDKAVICDNSECGS